MSTSIRALVAVAMLVGVYVLGVAVMVVLGVTVVLAIAKIPALGLKLLFVLAPVAMGIGSALIGFRRKVGDDGPPPGLLLTEDHEPRLWQTVRRLADEAGTRPPDEIRLVPFVNAAVSEDSAWLGLRPGTRRMFVGVPLLIGLGVSEMVFVLAHELGHYSGSHTRLGPVVYRGLATLGRVIERVGPRSVTGRVFVWYTRAYVAVSGSLNRHQELEADELGARIAGPLAGAAALDQLGPIDVAWQEFLSQYAEPALAAGVRPDALLEASRTSGWTTTAKTC